MKDYIKETLCFGLDIGTRTVIGVVGYQDGDTFVLVDYECKEHEERAMMDGQIHDIHKVARCVYDVKSALEKRLQMTLSEVGIAAAGRALSTQMVEVTQAFEEEQEVTLSDIHHLELEGLELAKSKQAEQQKKQMDYYCVAYSVITYSIDDYEIANLEGHKGYKIGAKLLATFLPKQVIDSLYAVTERSELTVTHLTLEPIAAINAVIPEQIRLLNLALVDIGAGTSDIAITKDGSVIAYGMIPVAGDEVTEAIVHQYLVDFTMAEEMKKQAAVSEMIHYTDIIGITHDLPTSKLKKVMAPLIDAITMQIAERILILNGSTSPNAVFCVGGGSQMLEVTTKLSKHLKLQEERVALRSIKHLVKFKDEVGMPDTPQMITPLGICITMLQNKLSQFTFVTVNDQKVQLLNAKKLTILDAIVATGIEHYEIFPKKGATLMFKLNGERHRIKGQQGIPSKIILNGVEASIQAHIQDGDIIEVQLAQDGKTEEISLETLVPAEKSIKIDETNYVLPLIKVNGVWALREYQVLPNDEIITYSPDTIGALLEVLEIDTTNKLVTKQFEAVTLSESLVDGAVYLINTLTGKSKSKEEPIDTVEMVHQQEEAASIQEVQKTTLQLEESSISQKQVVKPQDKKDENLYVVVNNEVVGLPPKESPYIFAGIFDYIDFDLSKPQGTIQLIHNGQQGALTDILCDGDILEIYWKK